MTAPAAPEDRAPATAAAEAPLATDAAGAASADGATGAPPIGTVPCLLYTSDAADE